MPLLGGATIKLGYIGFLIAGVAAGALVVDNFLVVSLVLVFAATMLYLTNAHNVPVVDRRFLFNLALVALLVRLLLIVATHSFSTPFFTYILTSDALYYEQLGKTLAEAWHDGSSIIIPSGNYGYFFWNGMIYYLVGFKPDLLRVLNSITAVCVGFNLYYISHRLGGQAAARISFVLAVFFPSAILWSSLNLKDSLIIFFLTLIVKINLELMERFRPGRVLLMCLLLMVLVSLRFYIGILLAMCITLSYIFTATRFGGWQRLVYTAVLLVTVGFTLHQMGYGFMGMDFILTQNIETIGEQHQSAAYGGAAFAEDVTLDGCLAALKYMPVGIFYFLFGPLPWQSMGPIGVITVPEMLLMYTLYGYFIVGLKSIWRHQRGAGLFLVVVIICFGLVYSLGSGNMGGLYRIRLQVIMPAFVLISIGLQNSRVLSRVLGRLKRKKAPVM